MICSEVFTVEGTGAAALAATAVLLINRVPTEVSGQRRDGPRFLKLSPPTVSLLEHLFACELRRELPCLVSSTRFVDWGDDVGPMRLADDGLIVKQKDLLQFMSARTYARSGLTSFAQPDEFIVRASGRGANANLVGSKTRVMTCWNSLGGEGLTVLDTLGVDSLTRAGEEGWVFLARAPSGDVFAQVATLTSDSGQAAKLLALVLNGQESLPAPDATFECSPAFGRPVVGERCLECGDAAVAFDPICGDGLGNAVRSGVLAAYSLLRMATHPEERPAILAHYRQRLLDSYIVHVDACSEVYSNGRLGLAWRNYAAELDRQVARLRALARPTPLYAVAHGALAPVDPLVI